VGKSCAEESGVGNLAGVGDGEVRVQLTDRLKGTPEIKRKVDELISCTFLRGNRRSRYTVKNSF